MQQLRPIQTKYLIYLQYIELFIFHDFCDLSNSTKCGSFAASLALLLVHDALPDQNDLLFPRPVR